MAEMRAYPLSWPDGWKRTAPSARVGGHFNKKETVSNEFSSWKKSRELTIMDAVTRVLSQLSMMGISRDDVIISTNVPTRLDGLPRGDARKPADPGAAVYWRPRAKTMRCMAVDRYDSVADNIAAIAATLEAMRAIERHGGAEILDRTFRGFAALPERTGSHWREILGFSQFEEVNAEDLETAFRRLAMEHHPDRGGDSVKFHAIVEARQEARKELSIPEVGAIA